MNKLVSKNPVQRFKLGQKIEKLQDGGWIGYYTPGNWPKSGNYSSKVAKKQPIKEITIEGGQLPGVTVVGKRPNQNTIIDGGQLPEVVVTGQRKTSTASKKATTPKSINYSGTVWDYLNSKANQFGGWQTNPNGNKYFVLTTDDGTKLNVFGNGQMYRQNGQLAGSITEQDIINANQRKIPVKKSSPKVVNINPISFKTAFNNARNAGQETFNWRGQTYNTRNKGEENYVFQNGKWVNPTSNITFQAPEFQSEYIEVPLTASITSPSAIIPNKITVPQITYDRTGIRQLIRDRGFNPYQFSGAQRRALRMVMNGQGTDTDRAIVSGMGIFKNGGLISRNPIQRFKSNR